MASNASARLPRLVSGIDLRGLPIGPAEAFVLSRVDGTSSEIDIAAATGLPPEQVSETLVRLEALGAVSFVSEAEPPPVAERPRRAPARPSGAYRLGVVETRTVESDHPAATLYDPGELDEAVDIELGKKRQILDSFYRLDSATHYALLNVDPSADKKVIKKAYYEIVGTYHPDRYFGKNLGSFKTKLEKIFARLTEAYDVLTRPASRAEYDSYLEAQRRTQAFDHALEPNPTRDHALRVAEIQRQIEEEARSLERADHGIFVERSPAITETGAAPDSAPQSGAPSTSGTRPAQPTATAPMDQDARRRALARKLGRSLSGQTPAVSSSSTTSSAPPAEWAAEQLKRRYEQHVLNAKLRQVEHYVAAADEAFARKDPISGVNALRIASGLAPDDAALKARLEEAQTRTSLELANSYIEQGQYEEREGRLAEAARSYEKATRGKPSARLHERTAHCLLESGGDVRLAGEHAKKAVLLAPDEAAYHVTLARFFSVAGMKQSALGELERAATLAPKDDTIRESIKRIKKGHD